MDCSSTDGITRGHQIQCFAVNLTQCFQACNDQCVKFISFINQQPFKNQREFEDALNRFRSTVLETAEGTQDQKKTLCDQIEYALLHPSKVVTHKVMKGSRGCQIDQSIVKLLMPGSCVASPRKCSVCNEGCGIMVTCSSQRCKKPLLHPDCAGQITFSKKNACSYYRCPSCVRLVPAAKPKSKRSSRKGKQPLKKPKRDSGDGEALKNDDAAAGTSKGSASDGSMSDGSDLPIVSETSSLRAYMVDEEDQAHSGDKRAENLRSELQSQHTHNDLSDDLAVFESACGHIVFIRDAAHSVHEDLKAAQLSVGGSVTVENADKVKVVLNQIKSGLNSLAELAIQYRVAYGMPANAYLPLEGSDVGASDALSNACSEVIAFDHMLSHINDQFDGLKSQAAVVVSSSKKANAPQHMCALPADRHTREIIEPTDQLPSGFEFRFYSAFLDPKIKEPRPISLKEPIGEIFEDASSHSTPTAVVRTLFLNGPTVLGFNANEAALKIRQGGIPLEDHEVTAIIKELVADKTLTPNHSVPGNFVSTPNLRPWKARRLYVNDNTYFDIQERDLGIWLDSSFGLPTSVPPIQFQCFYLCAGTSVTSISRAKFTTADIRDYMVYRANQIKAVCDMLRANQ